MPDEPSQVNAKVSRTWKVVGFAALLFFVVLFVLVPVLRQ